MTARRRTCATGRTRYFPRQDLPPSYYFSSTYLSLPHNPDPSSVRTLQGRANVELVREELSNLGADKDALATVVDCGQRGHKVRGLMGVNYPTTNLVRAERGERTIADGKEYFDEEAYTEKPEEECSVIDTLCLNHVRATLAIEILSQLKVYLKENLGASVNQFY